MLNKLTLISDCVLSYKKYLISREQLQLLDELSGLEVVNVWLKIKVKKILSTLLNLEWDGLCKYF